MPGQVDQDVDAVRDDLLAYKAQIGYVPEEAVLYTYLSGPEYLALVGSLRGLSPRTIQARTDGFLSLFGLEDDRHAPLSAYSKGMRQKILIAAGVLHNPRLIVLDEPFSGLDVSAARLLKQFVRSLAAGGRIVVFSSHVLAVVEELTTASRESLSDDRSPKRAYLE